MTKFLKDRSDLVAPLHFPADNHPLNLIGAFENLEDLRVAHQFFNRIFLAVAVTAEDLHRVGGHLHRHVRHEGLRDRAEACVVLAGFVDHIGAVVEQGSGRRGLNFHVGQHERNTLVFDDGLTEGPADHGVFGGLVDGALRNAQAAVGIDAAASVQRLHGDHKALAFFADEVLRRDAHIVET